MKRLFIAFALFAGVAQAQIVAETVKQERIAGKPENLLLTVRVTCSDHSFTWAHYLNDDLALWDSDDREALRKKYYVQALTMCEREAEAEIPKDVTDEAVSDVMNATQADLDAQKAAIDQRIANLEANIAASGEPKTDEDKAILAAAKKELDKLKRFKP